MTISAAEIARLREAGKAGLLNEAFWRAKCLALCDELELAQSAQRLHDSVLEGANRLQIENVDLQGELEKARAEGQRQHDYNVEQIAKYAECVAERDTNAEGWLAVDQQRIRDCTKLMAELDAARALLRDCAGYFWGTRAPLRARIAKLLGDA